MEKKYLIDTNIIIYYLNNSIPKEETEKIEFIFKNSFNISTITKIEILGWHKISREDKNKIERFIKNSNVIYIQKELEELAIRIKQEKKVATPDAIIAATAINYNLVVVTRNENDFNNIKGIEIYNPFTINKKIK